MPGSTARPRSRSIARAEKIRFPSVRLRGEGAFVSGARSSESASKVTSTLCDPTVGAATRSTPSNGRDASRERARSGTRRTPAPPISKRCAGSTKLLLCGPAKHARVQSLSTATSYSTVARLGGVLLLLMGAAPRGRPWRKWLGYAFQAGVAIRDSSGRLKVTFGTGRGSHSPRAQRYRVCPLTAAVTSGRGAEVRRCFVRHFQTPGRRL